jgi:hypothetical protein
MVSFHFLLINFLVYSAAVNGNYISDLIDFHDYNSDCVAQYLVNNYSFNLQFKPTGNCDKLMRKYEDAFYESVNSFVTTNSNGICITSLLKRHRVSDVLFKAIAYNYFKQLVKFSSFQSCDGVVDVLNVDHKRHEMRVNFIESDKSARNLRPCLDALFAEFNIEEIVFVNQNSSSIGLRRFGRHLKTFLSEIVGIGKVFCSELNLDLTIKYFFVQNHNQTQIECIKNFSVNNENSQYSTESKSSNQCEQIMNEMVDDAINIDLFGFTEASKRVKDCIIQSNVKRKLIERVIVMPKLLDHIDKRDNAYVRSTKQIIELTLSCLKSF